MKTRNVGPIRRHDTPICLPKIDDNKRNSDFYINAGNRTRKPNGFDEVGIRGGGFVIHHQPECKRLDHALSQDTGIAEALLDLVSVCERIRVVFGEDGIVFMIHFGGQDANTCRAFTCRMNEVAAQHDRLSRYRFIAVSVGNKCPDGFFQDGRLLPPNDETINAVLANWAAGMSEIPVCDHLRGIVLLCQALQNMDKEKREEKFSWRAGVEWWRSSLWGSEPPMDMAHAFSKAEMQILKKDELLDNFCSALFDNHFDLKNYDDDAILRKMVSAITKGLRNE